MQLKTNLSESVIKQSIGNIPVNTLVDLKTGLELRLHKSREKGTWSFIHYKKGVKHRERIGYWPIMKFSQAKENLVSLAEDIRTNSAHQVAKFQTVSELLYWYLERVNKEALKSESRRRNVKSIISNRLLPAFDNLPIWQINKIQIDERLILPLQGDGLRVSSIRTYYATLKKVFKTAFELGLVTVNPLSNLSFNDHIQKRIEPKAGKLLVSDLSNVIQDISELSDLLRILLMIMLMFGTRIGETRQLKWSYIDFKRNQINIPAAITKTQQPHTLPLTDISKAILEGYKENSKGEYLFSGKAALSASQADKMIRQATNGTYSAHDLRKLARSVWAHIGIDYWVSERLLNHKQKGLDAVYIKADSMDVKRKALTQYHEYLYQNKTGHILDTQKQEFGVCA